MFLLYKAFAGPISHADLSVKRIYICASLSSCMFNACANTPNETYTHFLRKPQVSYACMVFFFIFLHAKTVSFCIFLFGFLFFIKEQAEH